MSTFEAVIGLEVHAQLSTQSKLFCACSTQYGQRPNSNICPVCTGMPGALPVINERAVEYAVMMCLATGCTVNSTNTFARKNYFYPDLPMGYQISQFDQPVGEQGAVHIRLPEEAEAKQAIKRIGITRIHMESNAGKSIHSSTENISRVDLNRAGTPLIEIVSEPDMRSPEEVVAYLKVLHSILLYLGICDGNMEEGSFRCDANVSVRLQGETTLGTRTELKNMNSFRNIQRAVAYEIQRQEDMLLDGQAVIQQTRLFDAERGVTHALRNKENAHEYRYFPEPDLLPLVLDPQKIQALADTLPELPEQKYARFTEQYRIPEADAVLLTADRHLADWFEQTVRQFPQAKIVSNWLMTDILRLQKDSQTALDKAPFTPENFATLLHLVDSGRISQKVGRKVLEALWSSGGDPEEYVARQGLGQISDTATLEALIEEVLAAHPEETQALRAGKKKLTGFFVGQIMQKTKGQANPREVNTLLARKI